MVIVTMKRTQLGFTHLVGIVNCYERELNMNIRIKAFLGLFSLLVAISLPALAQESGWPRTLPVKEGSITVYPLQVESMTDDLVRFRAALAYRESDNAEPVFGAGWFVSKVEIDRTSSTVHPVNLMVSDTRFPAGTEDVKQDLTAVFAQKSQNWDLDFPLEDLVSSLEMAEQEAKSVQDLNTAPPTIIYKDNPALLISFDGEPVLRKIENSEYQAVINTSYPLIYNGNAYYLGAADDVWYRADNVKGPYRFVTTAPAEIVSMVDAAREGEAETEPAEKVTAANAPEIVVATTPTELIVTEGPAAFVPLVDDLLVLNNTTDDVFMHISTQQYYVVLAGRWYHSGSLNGPWTYRASDELPPAFASIPEQSDQADSRVYVAGTEEARDAVLDAQIPQTAAVERGTVDLDVSYDGEPQFEPVEGAQDLAYANNTGSTVLQSDREYYLVEDGVWYVSSQPNGPWEVSAYRPAQVASISPQSPVYNVKYVYIYDSTPDVVYVGYTPGYTGSYVYQSTIVYGTGFYYQPWVTPYYYYPRYSTWGFNVNYNSWSGWSFGLSWGWGPFYAGWYSGGYWHHGRPWYNRRYSCWGPRGYRPRPAHYGRYAKGRGGYDRGGYGQGGRGGQGRGGRGQGGYDDYALGGKGSGPGHSKNHVKNGYARNNNLYRDGAQRAKVADVSGYGRGGEKQNRLARKDGAQVKNGRSNKALVTKSELRVKAQTKDSKYNGLKNSGLNNNLLAKNTVSGKGKTAVSRSRGSWEKVPATNEVRRAIAKPARSGKKPAASGAARAGGTTRQKSSWDKTSKTVVKQGNISAARAPARATQDKAVKRSSSAAKAQKNGTRKASVSSAKTTQVKPGTRSRKSVPASEVSRRQVKASGSPQRKTNGVTSQRQQPKVSTPQKQQARVQRQQPKVSTPQKQQPRVQRQQPKVSTAQRQQPRVQRQQPKVNTPQRQQARVSAPRRQQPKVSMPAQPKVRASAPSNSKARQSAPSSRQHHRSASSAGNGRSSSNRSSAKRGRGKSN